MTASDDFYGPLMGQPGWNEGLLEAERLRVFGLKLRLFREGRQLTQVELARIARVDQSDISRFEVGKWGKRGVSYEMLERILPALGLKLEHRVTSVADARLSAETRKALGVMNTMLTRRPVSRDSAGSRAQTSRSGHSATRSHPPIGSRCPSPLLDELRGHCI